MVTYISSYLLFFALLWLAKKGGANRLVTDDGLVITSPLLLWLHLAGIILFGLVPFWSATVERPLFFWPESWQKAPTLVSVFLFGLTVLLSPRLGTKQSSSFVQGNAAPALSYLTAYFLLRILFIAAYEIWFRGFLLQSSKQSIGLSCAIGLNLVLYTFLHTVNNKREMLLCLPFGVILCLLCTWQGAVWPAVLIHLALTLGYEFAIVRKGFTQTTLYEDSRHRRIRLSRS
jgi:membrane protease YdiL (CAAX protease family)